MKELFDSQDGDEIEDHWQGLAASLSSYNCQVVLTPLQILKGNLRVIPN